MERGSIPQALRPAAAETRHPSRELVEMLGRSIGLEVASAAVSRASLDLGVGPELTRVEALSLLERIAQEPGIVGIAARFTKSRVHLLWTTDLAAER